MSSQTKITREDAIGRAITAAMRSADRRADESIAYSQMAQAWALIAAAMRPDEFFTTTPEAK